MADEKFGFTGINYFVCDYCSRLMRGEHRDGYNEGCEQRRNEAGKYARITLGDETARLREHGIDSVNGLCGCEQFDPSGLPAHPQVLEFLVKKNPKCSVIPSDPNATETSWEFSDKMNRYLSVEHITSFEKVQ